MHRSKDVLTTGEVAKICNVAPRTVSKWFDSGQLRGYRIPGSKDRRIPVSQLVRFMKAHGIPLEGMDTGQVRLLLIDEDSELTYLLERTLTEQTGYAVKVADSAFEAGAILEQFKPNVLLVDVDVMGIDARSLTRFVASHPELGGIRLVACGASLSRAERQALEHQGFHATMTKPFSIQQVIEVVDELASVSA